MKPKEEILIQKALSLLHMNCTKFGILASHSDEENYKRIWARDCVIAGISGLYYNDEKIIDGLKMGLEFLGSNASIHGQIPSNVDPNTNTISYGGLVGRIDATTWWLIGLFEYSKFTGSNELLKKFGKTILKAIRLLEIWEFNGAGLLYSPLGGNWADEYVTQGYTLYDNILYCKVLEEYGKISKKRAILNKYKKLRKKLEINYYLKKRNSSSKIEKELYHPIAVLDNKFFAPYLVCSLGPNGVDHRFDMAGNGLALIFGYFPKSLFKRLVNFIQETSSKQGNYLLPVFSPIIFPENSDWNLLTNNYAHSFKNEPFNFHNGGCWPIWLGLLGMGVRKYGDQEISQNISNALNDFFSNETPNPFTFHEYIETQHFQEGGKGNLSYSAAGALFSLNIN
jgi:hypothetical protein